MLAPGGVRQAAIRTLIGAYVRFFPEFPNSTPQQSYVGGFSRKGQRRHTGSACDISGRLPYYLRQLEGPGATWARRASDSLGALFNAHRAALAAWGSRLGCGSCRPRCSPAGCRRHASGAVAQGRARRARHALRTAVVRERPGGVRTGGASSLAKRGLRRTTTCPDRAKPKRGAPASGRRTPGSRAGEPRVDPHSDRQAVSDRVGMRLVHAARIALVQPASACRITLRVLT
jgi:hypothetical protein